MLLSREEAEMFFKLHSALMQYVTEQLKLAEADTATTSYSALPLEKRRQVGQAFLKRMDLLDAFLAANPAKLSPAELEVVSGWRHLVFGRFVALRPLRPSK